MSTSFRLILPRQLYSDMVAHVQSALPNEGCGLLAGRLEAGVGRAEAHYPLVNQTASPTEYYSEPFAAFRDMRQRGLTELVVYHSHPTSAPVPSRKDLERNYFGEVVIHIIIGLNGPEPEVRAWRLTDDAYHEADWAVVDEGGEGADAER